MTHTGEKRNYTGFQWGKKMQRRFLQDLRVSKRIMIKYDIKETGWQDVDWVYLALHRGNLSNLFDKVTSLWVLINGNDFFID